MDNMANGPQSFLELKSVTKRYPGEPQDSVSEVSLQIKQGDFLCVVGPSGAGKSTLLHLMGLLDVPTSGEVIILGQRRSALSQDECARLRGRFLGFVFQFHYLLPDLTVLDNVVLPLLIRDDSQDPSKQPNGRPARGWFGAGWRQRRRDRQKRLAPWLGSLWPMLHFAQPAPKGHRETAERLLDAVGLLSKAAKKPHQLSGGERQRAAVARALIADPVLVLADEPTGNLDSVNTAAVWQLLTEANKKKGTALVVVTHSNELARQAKTVIHMTDGKIVQTGFEQKF